MADQPLDIDTDRYFNDQLMLLHSQRQPLKKADAARASLLGPQQPKKNKKRGQLKSTNQAYPGGQQNKLEDAMETYKQPSRQL